ncbi:hypothetical protein [Tengunoibacter tsumagoiensis]|uniref:HEAT repeat domain-containing protein n=1 Tax=Tengunoibacter tsumagoiensis TaxID=2014871 RepID=A0A401ZXR2_9CHLR|nr:hypothetical protein [Tengunoibacter tsumagoiensis]GCE11646.1 hypothetical protein KTT_15050 [Tengunoibacter tsumagoiensis]
MVDTRPFEAIAPNVVELESRKNLRSKIHELIDLTLSSSLSTNAIREHLDFSMNQFGPRFAAHLVRALQRDNAEEREAIVWLLTLLHEPTTIPLLQQLSSQEQQKHPIRLSASLALAGMGATKEMLSPNKPARLYAIS